MWTGRIDPMARRTRTPPITDAKLLPLWLTVPQAAKAWQTGTRIIYQGCADGSIPCRKFGRTVRIARSVVIGGAEVTAAK
jgi:excisionase family DNA binding protein